MAEEAYGESFSDPSLPSPTPLHPAQGATLVPPHPGPSPSQLFPTQGGWLGLVRPRGYPLVNFSFLVRAPAGGGRPGRPRGPSPSQLFFPCQGPCRGTQEAVASCLGPLVNFSFLARAPAGVPRRRYPGGGSLLPRPPSQLFFPCQGPCRGTQEAVASCLGPLVNFSFPSQAPLHGPLPGGKS
jgi:hypothetical protein